VDPIAIAVNDLGEPDAGKLPVRFDEGRRLRAFYSTTRDFLSGRHRSLVRFPAQEKSDF